MNFSGIPNSVAPKDLENFILRLLQEIGINLDKSRVVVCHGLGKTDRTTVKLLIRKYAENVYLNKKKLKDVDISCLLSDDDIQDRNDTTTGSTMMISKIEMTRPQGAQGVKTVGWREVCPEKGKFLYRRISTLTTDICIV